MQTLGFCFLSPRINRRSWRCHVVFMSSVSRSRDSCWLSSDEADRWRGLYRSCRPLCFYHTSLFRSRNQAALVSSSSLQHRVHWRVVDIRWGPLSTAASALWVTGRFSFSYRFRRLFAVSLIISIYSSLRKAEFLNIHVNPEELTKIQQEIEVCLRELVDAQCCHAVSFTECET